MKNAIKLSMVILLILGVFFRFYHLDRKVYWLDETFTALRVSGYSATELVEVIPKNQAIGIEEIQAYYHPSGDRHFSHVAQALANNAEHSPLYFVMVRFWRAWFGSSVAATRSLSAVISLCAFPAIYWLCQELFKRPITGWIGMGLLAISPFQVLYAQEARQYSLLAVITLLSSAALLRIIRLSNQRLFKSSIQSRLWGWGLYTGSLILGFYTHLLFGLVLLAHGIYLLWLEHFRWSDLIRAYCLATVAGVIGFMPWIGVIIINLNKVTESATWQGESQRPAITFYLKSWLGNTARQFVDFGLSSDTDSVALKLFIPILLSVVFLVVYSLYFARQSSDRQTFLFLIALVVIPWLILAIPDLVSGSTRSNIQRYIIPTFLGMQLSVAHLLATKIGYSKPKVAHLWQMVTVLLISLGIISCALSAQAQVWWNKRADAHSLEIASIVNASEQPLLIAKAHPGMRLGVLSYQLNPKVQVWLIEDDFPEIPQGYEPVFIYDPPPTVISELQPVYNSRLNPVSDSKNPRTGLSWLWELHPLQTPRS